MPHIKPHRVWTIVEAKARLSEILRLAETEGPQRIGARKPFVAIPVHMWAERKTLSKPLGKWLAENAPRGTNLETPSRHECGGQLPRSE